ncbi:Uncharacterised protein [Mycobacteroides abscessus subsp. abscessus]|nr:Uncharacterised protein [Mycobacteroides abscessus subsp. abscessus]
MAFATVTASALVAPSAMSWRAMSAGSELSASASCSAGALIDPNFSGVASPR